ncbi:S-adenosyl-L-methionine-dependent methyltransferase [Cercophora newfieldiana]|uniref:S-adenosyl-L-methionine-dependent methyltransferase n=1 Tax=Cercophora newfieldiana TaxID=92897 RepID=A0AA40CLV6_9PEZI|nr:S-adenosyl-L-methionine-dependent methyltransferase [Cercophora newfieldiana]
MADATADVTDGILPGDHWIQVPETGNNGDGDSAISDPKSSTASLTSSILDYRTIQGRTYHSERGNAQYWAANDAAQLDSMDIAHHSFTLALDGKLFSAPLKDDELKNVLDVGTGTGLWAIDFADTHPQASVVGTDVSPIQPTWIPPNLRFEIEDCTQEWTFQADLFDYTHIRFLVGSVDDWDLLFARAFAASAPGGYVESVEPSAFITSDDGTVTPTMALGQWGKLFVSGSRKFGRTFELYEKGTVRAAMEKAGFVDIKEIDMKMPLGGWESDPKRKELGLFIQLGFLRDPEGYILFLAHALGWTKDQIEVYLAHLRKELKDPKVHSYYWQKIVWGRKPAA